MYTEKRKIIAVTGARSEYDLLFEVYNKLNSCELIEFSIIVTGSHLSKTYGNTVQNIKKDGFRISDKLFNLIESDDKCARILSLANQIPGIVQTLLREKPDIVLVAGDREEAISVTMTCAFMDIAVAHFFGGDIAKDGNIDNSIRYASSKFAHIHFTTLEQHKENLLKLGEDRWRIFNVGNPALDRFINTKSISKAELFQRIGLPLTENENYLILIHHPIITELQDQHNNIKIILDSILKSGYKCIINSPNSDPGNHEITAIYNQYANTYPDHFFTFKNLERDYFVNLLRHTSCLMGNSSAGILEAPSLGIPVINIGSRQRGRISAENVIFVDYDSKEIEEALEKSMHDSLYRNNIKNINNPYGNGNSSELIFEIITSLDLKAQPWLHKNITY